MKAIGIEQRFLTLKYVNYIILVGRSVCADSGRVNVNTLEKDTEPLLCQRKISDQDGEMELGNNLILIFPI